MPENSAEPRAVPVSATPSKGERPDRPQPQRKKPEESGNDKLPGFRLYELIELSLCAPEIGAVNFNVLRIFLRATLKTLGIEQQPVSMNDLEAHQVQNFKNYVQGSQIASPMPGVLRLGPSGVPSMAAPAPAPSQAAPAPAPSQAAPGAPAQAAPSTSQATPSQAPSSSTTQQKPKPPPPKTPKPGGAVPHLVPSSFVADSFEELAEKVAHLEKHLEALYQLPDNEQLISVAKGEGQGGSQMSVNDMWQIIQLNNRIAAAEAAIQKMASLIEDLAKSMGKVKGDTKVLKSNADELIETSTAMSSKTNNLHEKCDNCEDIVKGLKKEVDQLKQAWKKDREKIEQSLGVELGSAPTFMKPKPKPETGPQKEKERKKEGQSEKAVAADSAAGGEDPSEQFERGTQTFVKAEKKPAPPTPKKKRPSQIVDPEKISQMTAAEIAQNITAEDIRRIPPEIYKEMSPEQKKAIQDIRKAAKKQEPDEKKELVLSTIIPAKLKELSPKIILEQMSYEEAVSLTDSVKNLLTPEQKDAVQKVIQRGKPAPPKPAPQKTRRERSQQKSAGVAVGVASMEDEELQNLSPDTILKMPHEEAASLRQSIVDKMSPEQKEALAKVIEKGPPKSKRAASPPKAIGVAVMEEDEIQELSPKQLQAMPPEEAANLPKEVLNKMTKEQKAVVKRRATITEGKKKPAKEPMGIVALTPEKLQNVSGQDISENLGWEEAKAIPNHVLEKMSEEQKAAIQKVIDKGPKKKKPGLNVALLTKEQLEELTPEQMATNIKFSDAKNVPPAVLEKMSEDQRAAVQSILDQGPREGDTDDDDDFSVDEFGEEEKEQPKRKSNRLANAEIQEIAKLTPEQIRELSPEQAAQIPDDVLQRKFKPEQIREIKKLREQATGIHEDEIQEMSPSDLISSLTPEQLRNIPDEQFAKLTHEQQKAIKEALRSLDDPKPGKATQIGDHGEETQEEEEGADYSNSGSGRRKSRQKPQRKEKKHHHHHKHHKHHEDDDADGSGKHAKIDVVSGPIPAAGEPLPPITLEEYLASLPPEEAANLAADAVQRELQKQYQQLQGMQRQLAQDIQEKMEFIYQKLLREIVSQQLTTSPYMAVGGPEQCLGPGICTGHGMPAGIAVVQFPEVKDKAMVATEADSAEPKVCPGPPICPGKDVCPYCRAGKDGLAALRGIDKKPGDSDAAAPLAIGDGRMITELNEALIQEMKSLMLLDLEKIRDEMRSKKMGAYDEQDILERLSAVWEALKILKHNEETIAVKIAKQDAMFKRLPQKTIEKLSKIPDENLEMIATGNFSKPMYIPEDHNVRTSTMKDAEEMFKMTMSRGSGGGGGGGGGGADKEDIQTLFNNLANVIAECTEQKDRIDQLADTARILESGMVTKQMMMDALSDKADKGLINTKVSYDEFGNTIDELHSQLHNLMVEGYQRNENWKKVTADLAEELAEKLDKVELAPIRAFFKSHLKNLEEKVKTLSQLIEEPDPAGTRKKLLRDYNCLSCDRMVNLAGVTSAPTLPLLGPIKAGHTTASKRALELHRMRMMRQFNANTKNLNALEKHGRAQTSRSANNNDLDVMDVVNRYTGGSHTAISNANRILAQRGSHGSGRNAIEELFDNTTRHHQQDDGQAASIPPSHAPSDDGQRKSFAEQQGPVEETAKGTSQAGSQRGSLPRGSGGAVAGEAAARTSLPGSQKGSIRGSQQGSQRGSLRGSQGGGGVEKVGSVAAEAITEAPPRVSGGELPPVTSSVGSGGAGGSTRASGGGARVSGGGARASGEAVQS